MKLTCPHCGFSKEVPANRVPANTTKASCPRCKLSFPVQAETQIEAQSKCHTTAPPTQLERQLNAALRPKAGFWLRAVAALIDFFIVAFLQFLLGSLLSLAGVLSSGFNEGNIATTFFLVQLFGYALSCVYYVVFTGNCGQTPGKMVLRIKVIRSDGTDISYNRAALREIVAKFISGAILAIGFLMVAFDEHKQGLHDRIVDTYVIKL